MRAGTSFASLPIGFQKFLSCLDSSRHPIGGMSISRNRWLQNCTRILLCLVSRSYVSPLLHHKIVFHVQPEFFLTLGKEKMLQINSDLSAVVVKCLERIAKGFDGALECPPPLAQAETQTFSVCIRCSWSLLLPGSMRLPRKLVRTAQMEVVWEQRGRKNMIWAASKASKKIHHG